MKSSAWLMASIMTAEASTSAIHTSRLTPKPSTTAVIWLLAKQDTNRSSAMNAQPCSTSPRYPTAVSPIYSFPYTATTQAYIMLLTTASSSTVHAARYLPITIPVSEQGEVSSI